MLSGMNILIQRANGAIAAYEEMSEGRRVNLELHMHLMEKRDLRPDGVEEVLALLEWVFERLPSTVLVSHVHDRRACN